MAEPALFTGACGPSENLDPDRAGRPVHELPFDRIYALRVRAFAMNHRGAEEDMHFSLTRDMLALDAMAEILQAHGIGGLVARLSDAYIQPAGSATSLNLR